LAVTHAQVSGALSQVYDKNQEIEGLPDSVVVIVGLPDSVVEIVGLQVNTVIVLVYENHYHNQLFFYY